MYCTNSSHKIGTVMYIYIVLFTSIGMTQVNFCAPPKTVKPIQEHMLQCTYCMPNCQMLVFPMLISPISGGCILFGPSVSMRAYKISAVLLTGRIPWASASNQAWLWTMIGPHLCGSTCAQAHACKRYPWVHVHFANHHMHLLLVVVPQTYANIHECMWPRG